MTPPGNQEAEWVQAAVLVPIFERRGVLHVVYIVRSADSPVHRSQMAFPGGRHRDSEDGTFLETALREAEEEIGLRRDVVDVVGELPLVRTMTSNFVIAPFVGRIPEDTEFRLDPREVSEVFIASVDELRAEETRRDTLRTLHDGTEAVVPTFTVHGRIIWGATERITELLLGTL